MARAIISLRKKKLREKTQIQKPIQILEIFYPPLNRASPIKVVLRRNLGERKSGTTRFISVSVGIANYTEHYVKCAFVIARLPPANKG